MSRPKLASELHPNFPKTEVTYRGDMKYVEFPSWEAKREFYKTHPEFDSEGDYEFLCTICFEDVDEDHYYCPECGEHSGQWMYRDINGNILEDN